MRSNERPVSDVPAGAAAATPSAFPATAAPALDKKPAPPALAEDVRKTIFIELQQIVARAQREAGAAYPTGERAPMLSPTNVEKPGKLSGKRETMAISLERSYLSELLTRRSLACTSARDITPLLTLSRTAFLYRSNTAARPSSPGRCDRTV